MFCIECGKALPQDAKFCIHCGAKVVLVEEVLPVPAAPEEHAIDDDSAPLEIPSKEAIKAEAIPTPEPEESDTVKRGDWLYTPPSELDGTIGEAMETIKAEAMPTPDPEPSDTFKRHDWRHKSTPAPKPTPEPENLKPLPDANTETYSITKRSIMHWYFVPFRKYAVFSGRASRTEYWMFFLWYLIIGCILAYIEGFLGIAFEREDSVLTLMYLLVGFIPWIALSVRRLHDINMSGFWLLLSLIPLFGWLFVIGTGCTNSDPVENKYGPNPKLEVS